MYGFILVLASFFSYGVGKVDWCAEDLNCQPGNNGPDYKGWKIFRTAMCGYGSMNRNCLNPTELLHEEDDKKLLLDHHNAYRYLYANRFLNQSTSVCKIGFLKWDKDLEEKAKEWGKECPFVKKFCPPQHNIEQSVDILHDDEPPTSNLSVFFKNWFLPFEMMSDKDEEAILKSWHPGAWNKASLALWARTEKVGCSFIYFQSKDAKLIEHFCLIKAPLQHFRMLICNYSPPGNVHGAEILPTTCGGPSPEPRPSPLPPNVVPEVPGIDISEIILPDVILPPDEGDVFINVSALEEPTEITTANPTGNPTGSQKSTAISVITVTPSPATPPVAPTEKTKSPHSSSPSLFSFANILYILIPHLVSIRKDAVRCLLILSSAVWLDLVSAGSRINVGNVGLKQ